MASADNRLRRKWQDYSGKKAGIAENDFFAAFQGLFENTEFGIRSKPTEFSNIYLNVELSEKVIREIYNPPNPITRHGVSPDYAIDNTITKKKIYIEIKRQDGWVEGGIRADGRGNAGEVQVNRKIGEDVMSERVLKIF